MISIMMGSIRLSSAVTRVGLTLQQAMGIPVDKWGTGSMETQKPVSEILA